MNSTDPSAWPLEDFPHPNPYFPAPPRPEGIDRALWRVFCGWGWVLLVPAGIALMWMYSQGDLRDIELMTPDQGAVLGLTLIVAGPFFFVVGRMFFNPWRSGQIVPALVLKVRAGRPTRVYEWPAIMLLNLFNVSGVIEEFASRANYLVRYRVADRVYEARIWLVDGEPDAKEGNIIWIATTERGRHPHHIRRVAHPSHRYTRVPQDVYDSARRALIAEDPREALNAARANAKAADYTT